MLTWNKLQIMCTPFAAPAFTAENQKIKNVISTTPIKTQVFKGTSHHTFFNNINLPYVGFFL